MEQEDARLRQGRHGEQADDDAARARRMHERTGEIELLISGALVFGLLRIPELLGGTIDVLSARLNDDQFLVAFFAVFYVKLIVYTLIVSFGFHLVTRAYWVGLIGLDSVFPEGVDWSRIRYGPLAKQVYSERIPPLARMARRADDFGSTIFSFSFWIVVLFAFSIVAGGVAAAAWFTVRALVAPELDGSYFFVTVVAVAMLPSLAIGVDKVSNGRLDPEGRPARLIKGVVGGAYWVTGGPLFMPIQFTLFSRVSKKVMWPLFIGVFASLLVGIMLSEFARSGQISLSPSALLPARAGPRSVDAAHFATTRDPNDDAPFIQSDIVDGPYVKLTVPLIALRAYERIQAVCPDIESSGGAGLVSRGGRSDAVDEAYERTLLACMARVWLIKLDGSTLETEWDLVWGPSGNVSSIVTYLPTEELASGAHVLEVEEIPQRSTPAEAARLAAQGETPPRSRLDYIRFRI